MATPEAFLQQACWVYAQQVLPLDADYASVETKLGVDDQRRAAQRKAAGIRAGEPDARLIWRGRYYGIEFKAGSALSDIQRIRHTMIRFAGGDVYVPRSVVELATLFAELQIPLKHTSLTPEHRDMMWRAKVEKQRARQKATKALSREADVESGTTGPKTRVPFKPRASRPTRKKVAMGNRMSLVGAPK